MSWFTRWFHHDCFVHGHRFEGRHDHVSPGFMDRVTRIRGNEIPKDRIYVRDVCVRCGATIERNQDG